MNRQLIFLCAGLLALNFFIAAGDSRAAVINSASAQSLGAIEEAGLVPCGRSGQAAGCQTCDIFKLAKNITDFMVYASFAVITIAIGVGGFMIMAGSYSEKNITLGKEIATSAVIGLLITLFAWFAVDTTIKVLVGQYNVSSILSGSGAGGFSGLGPWNSFQCSELKF